MTDKPRGATRTTRPESTITHAQDQQETPPHITELMVRDLERNLDLANGNNTRLHAILVRLQGETIVNEDDPLINKADGMLGEIEYLMKLQNYMLMRTAELVNQLEQL